MVLPLGYQRGWVLNPAWARRRTFAPSASITKTCAPPARSDTKAISRSVGDQLGSVSMAVAWSMAQGALAKSNADVAVAITGIAGPDGGSDKKPIGTVVFARAERDADAKDIVADTRHFENNGRGGVRLQAALCALELLMPHPEEAP